jgi:hypothetical protein
MLGVACRNSQCVVQLSQGTCRLVFCEGIIESRWRGRL